MSVEICVTASGILSIQPMPEAAPAVDERWVRRLQATFTQSTGAGLLLLAGEALSLPLPPSPAYWRDFARRFLHRLCQTSGGESHVVVPAVTESDDLESYAREAPPMRGGEFLDANLLARQWAEMGREPSRHQNRRLRPR